MFIAMLCLDVLLVSDVKNYYLLCQIITITILALLGDICYLLLLINYKLEKEVKNETI